MSRSKLVAVGGAALAAAALGIVVLGGDPPALRAGSVLVRPVALDFGSGRSEAPLELTNDGATVVTFEVSSAAVWLSAEPAGANIAPGDTITVTVRVDRLVVPDGEQRATLLVAADGEASLPVTVVGGGGIAATGPARLEVTPFVDLGSVAGAANVRVSNRGAEPLSWEASPEHPWVTLAPDRGTLGGGESLVARLSVDRSGLPTGSAGSSVALTSNGGDARVEVRLSVGDGPLLVLPDPVLDFGVGREGTKELSARVRNGGHTPLTYQVSTDHPFVTPLAGSSGTVDPGEESTIRVRYDFAVAYEGARRVPLRVRSNGGSSSFTIIGATDRLGPQALDRVMGAVHEHCSKGSCTVFRHATARVTDAGTRVTRARVQFQLCQGAPSSAFTCDGWRFVEMEQGDDDIWTADVGPLDTCTPGLSTFLEWRVVSEDASGNPGVAPGSSTRDARTHCRRSGEYSP